jgi:hypothetical protein
MIKNADNITLIFVLRNLANTIYIGKTISIYLGILENVPVKVGTRTVNQEKIRNDARIRNRGAISNIHIAPIAERHSKSGIQKASV